MKINLKSFIKIIKSNPSKGQLGIKELVGSAHKVAGHWRQVGNDFWEYGDIEIFVPIYGGKINLNKTEYEVVTLDEYRKITGVYSYMNERR